MLNSLVSVLFFSIPLVGFFLISLTLSSLGTRVIATPSSIKNSNKNNDEDIHLERLSAESSAVGRGLQTLFLVLLSNFLFKELISLDALNTSQVIFISFFSTLSIGILLHIIASAICSMWINNLRTFTFPIGKLLNFISRLPLISKIISFLLSRGLGNEAVDQDVYANLQERLEQLEDDVIPADEEELKMIRGILRMDTVKVREIMVPRVDMITADSNQNLTSIIELMNVGGHSKIPIYKDSIDTIVGIAYARDALGTENKKIIINELVRPALRVPESQSLEKLLRELQEHRTSIAIVIDEYGGVSGLVTVTDLIEEIVGELVDEFDIEGPEVQKISDSVILVDAGVSIDYINQYFTTHILADGFDTVGGLILKHIGKMPSIGEVINIDKLRITVQHVIGRRITRARVELLN